jgi:hypothetical protein
MHIVKIRTITNCNIRKLQHFLLIFFLIQLITYTKGTTLLNAETEKPKKSPISSTAFGEASYRETQFYEEDYSTFYTLFDSRLEYWLPLGRASFSWGPYIRLAWVSSSEGEAFANVYNALPGGGFHIYPFSYSNNEDSKSLLVNILGPLRILAEYNRVEYKGSENEWRPDSQIRAGVEYWRSYGVNNLFSAMWYETWLGAIWHSTNEFDDEYDTLILSGVFKIGIRIPEKTIISQLTPYGSAEAIKTKNEEYYWENKVVVGGGLRWSPPQRWIDYFFLQRFVLFVEYLYTINYLEEDAPSSVPDDDFRVGISFSFGEWFR